LSERPTYLWSYLLSWGLTVSGGTLAVVSVLAYFMPGTIIPPDISRLLCVIAFAGMVGFSVACANCTAAAAQHAISASKFYVWTFWPALICTFGFCVTTGIGVHLGWSLMTQGITSHDLPDAMLVNAAAVFIALAKPAMNWIIEGRRGIDRDASDAAEVAENARLDAVRLADIASRSENVTQLRPRLRRNVVGAAAAASALLLSAPHDVAEAAPLTQTDAPETQTQGSDAAPASAPSPARRSAAKRTASSYETRVANARKMLLDEPHLSNREVARRTHVSPSKVDRLARELMPMRNGAAA